VLVSFPGRDSHPPEILEAAVHLLSKEEPVSQPVASWSRNLRWMSFVAALALGVLAFADSQVAHAQIPDEFTNLKVLPKDISKGELVGVMRGFAGGLGVRCSHCHEGPDNLQGMDFATDDKETKRTARAMMLMMKAINSDHLAKLDTEREEVLEVKCATCHRKQSMPRFVEDVIATSIEKDGIDAAVARYRELREEYYGGYAYDFTAGPLSGLGEKLARAEKTSEALAILELNSEFNPRAVWNRVLVAQVQFSSGNVEAAFASLEKALEYEPDNQFVKGQLEKMKAAAQAQEEESS
jgi:tetratricopeptide (TPR) repeat protein